MNQIILFIIIFFTYNLFANETNLTTINPDMADYSAKLKISKIDFIKTCGECCDPANEHPCEIYYIMCKLKSLYNVFFVYSTADLNDSGIFAMIIKNIDKLPSKNGIFIVENGEKKKAYFEENTFYNIFSEMHRNINTLEEHTANTTSKQYLDDLKDFINKAHNEAKENGKLRQRPKKLKGVTLQQIPWNGIIHAFVGYNQSLTRYNSGNYVQVYHPDLLANCTRQEQSFQTDDPITAKTNKIATVAPTVKTTNAKLYIPSTDYYNNTANYNLPPAKKTSSSNNTIIYGTIAGVIGGSIIIIVVAYIIFVKLYKKDSNKSKKTQEKTVEYAKQIQDSNEHIYEEPYFPKVPDSSKKLNHPVANIPNENKTGNDSEQNSATSDIIISSQNPDNKQFTVIVVNTGNAESEYSGGSTNKAILINLPTKQSPPKAKIVEQPPQYRTPLPAIEDGTQKHIYNVLEVNADEHPKNTEVVAEKCDDKLDTSTNENKLYDYNTLQYESGSMSVSSQIKPSRTNRKKSPHKYINIDIPATESSDTLKQNKAS